MRRMKLIGENRQSYLISIKVLAQMEKELEAVGKQKFGM